MGDTIVVEPTVTTVLVSAQNTSVSPEVQSFAVTVASQPNASLTVAPQTSMTTVQAPGPQGPPGTGGGATVVAQSSPAATWVITHNLGRTPILDVYVGGQQVTADVIDTSPNVATIVFATPQTGEVVYS